MADTKQPEDEKSPHHNPEDASPWSLQPRVQDFRQRDAQSGFPMKELGITWQDLTVHAVAAEATIHDNVVTQFNALQTLQERRHKSSLKTILDNSHGCVKPGEMLLVLGRPGSGCTTLLNILSNQRRGYASVSGDVHYGSMDAAEAECYRGQILLNTEDELFFPSLTVSQTMDFATRLKTPFKLPETVASKEDLRRETRDFLLQAMGIEHTLDTKVGNEFIRGVSGGERKRVSIIECLATRGSVYCWDNSTRGLDASTALEYTKAIRAFTDVLGLSTIVTLYQAGNGIYNLFDKVLVLDGGRQVFYGPRQEARPFAEALGFVCQDGANVADFLTGITVPTERKVRKGYENTFPRNAQALQSAYERSSVYTRMVAEYDYPSTAAAKDCTALFQEAISMERDHQLSTSSPLTVGFVSQVHACVIRQYQIIWGDKVTFFMKQLSVLMQALVAGSLFYDAPNTTAGLFVKSGALFFGIMFNSLLAMSEVTDSFTGRPVLAKHRSFALIHPAAYCLAQITADIPIILFQISVFSVVLYFMVGLKMDAESFFTFWIILVVTTMCMTALFRAVGATFSTFDKATKVSGLVIIATVLYNGYMIPKPKMHPWFVWIFWINPLAYAFEALMSNEFHDAILPCVGPNLVPVGPGYNDTDHQSCAGVAGAIPGQTSVFGDNYLKSMSYQYSHLWRNVGILCAFWVLFVFATIVATSNWRFSAPGGMPQRIPREKAKTAVAPCTDEESQSPEKINGATENSTLNEQSESTDGADGALVRNTSVFTWKNLSYTIGTPTGERTLLDNVQGWVKPGMLGALMGASGAGKTTLLDVLAQRKTDGAIKGSIMVDGRPLPVSFQRSAGYCEQLDVHEPFATVREALEFSALLRQPRDVPRAEKLEYVDTIIALLELGDLADTLIGTVGDGLSVEQRKRVTIAVELVSKPSILIFLDEPTSGLDGQSAFNTVRFLRKLADVGQAVLVTIHQPSAQLFAQFDSLLLLAKGGKTVYFGDIGNNADTVKAYFNRNGAMCPVESNPAEFIIDVVSGHLSQGRDWADVWLASPEHRDVETELDQIISDAAEKPPATVDDGHEFAMPLWDQIKIVTHRMNVSMLRNTDYINNKFVLHIFCALYNGFSFWKIGDSLSDLQLRLFTIFNFIFVAPGVINQLQPLFIERRDIFETREKKSKMYSWVAFVTGLVVSEIPYLVICAMLYYVCWYYTVGFPTEVSRAGSTFFVMLMYEFIYTGIGQFVAAYAPNAVFAALVNPFVLGTLIMFCGVLVSYDQITPFWRYWIYYLNPFNYLMGSLLVFDVWDQPVNCDSLEFAVLNPPNGSTCGDYLSSYLSLEGMGAASNLINPDAVAECHICPYQDGSSYLRTLNLKEYSYGWRDAGIVVIFVLSSYSLVFVLMKLRTKTSKKAQ
ncbi:ABC-2 type transporter-domain-containing protein [Dactylonectria estremocensis]|uniref:ABC-2 type transporter-domain-containing protein n=1 Tax=Dactylonectria estremocensis TaxID=1079267 RepID=A0A9P9IQR8_9HYPO|nr:ABC-2 type transporter-domain-containing protein [Dactylonectria estremocensis]